VFKSCDQAIRLMPLPGLLARSPLDQCPVTGHGPTAGCTHW
jgi:hypothetical protein